jgi:hypothetical protein
MSREEDNRIAREVMGWTWYESATEAGWQTPDGDWAVTSEQESRFDMDVGMQALPFTTDPAAAWLVVEKMRTDGWGLSISDPWSGRFRVTFMRDPAKAEVGVCEVPTGPGVMPEAVTRAALAALSQKGQA